MHTRGLGGRGAILVDKSKGMGLFHGLGGSVHIGEKHPVESTVFYMCCEPYEEEDALRGKRD